MKNIKYLISAVLMLFCASIQAEEITEGFEDVSIVDANGNAVAANKFGVGLSNGWKVVGGNVYTDDYSTNYGFSSTAKTGSKALVGVSASNAAIMVIPVPVTGKISFYARQVGTSNSTRAYVDLFEMEPDGEGFKAKSSTSFQYWRMTTSYTKYEYDLGSDMKYVGIRLQKTLLDDVIYNTISTDPHEHSYATTWSRDETGHWHACTSETGYCDAPKGDFAAHDGLTCSVCGYESYAIRTFPWTEDFESITSGIPTGWDNSEGTTTTDSYKWNYYNKSVRFNSYYNSNGNTNVLATPYIILPAEGVYDLKFKVKNPQGGNYSVKIGEYGSEERTTVVDNLTNIANWTEQTVDLSAYAGKAIKVYFCGTSNYASGDAYLYLDDVTVKELIAHIHDYATEWSTDRTNHWHACLNEVGDCNAPVSDLAAHSFDENDVCTVCGYELKYFVDFENGIPSDWENNGWEAVNNPSYGNGTKMAYAGRYADDNTLTTPYLIAKKDEVISLEALLPWDDETLKMEYSTDDGETWTLAFSETPVVNNTLCTLTWTAPADGLYKLRFSGRYNYIDNVCGFRYANLKDLKESELTITAANQWGTLCYPNEVEVPAGAQAYTATDVVDGVIELAEVEGTIPANTPVLVYAEKGATLTLPTTKHVTSLAEPVKADGNLFVGCTGAFTLEQNNQYVLQNQNGEVAFYRVNPEKPITTVAYRSYLETASAESGAKIGISFDDATGISEVKTENSNSIYDLSGRKVEKMQKGVIYIINNHKVIVK